MKIYFFIHTRRKRLKHMSVRELVDFCNKIQYHDKVKGDKMRDMLKNLRVPLNDPPGILLWDVRSSIISVP